MDGESGKLTGWEEVVEAWAGRSESEGLEWRTRKLIPETRWNIPKGAISYMQRGRCWWSSEGDQRWRVRLNRDEVVQIWTLGGCEDFVSDRRLYLMRSVILSQWRERKTVMWEDWGALTTAWALCTCSITFCTHLVTHLVGPHHPENPPGRPRALRISPWRSISLLFPLFCLMHWLQNCQDSSTILQLWNHQELTDDTQLYTAISPNDGGLLHMISSCVDDVCRWFLQNGLLLNSVKTEAILQAGTVDVQDEIYRHSCIPGVSTEKSQAGSNTAIF